MALPAKNLQEDIAPSETRQEAPLAPETRTESPVEKALERGPENVVSIFRGRAEEEKKALERLGSLEPEEAEAVPEATEKIEAANRKMAQEIAEVEQSALTKVESLLGTPPAPPAEAVKIAPVVAVGEAPKTETLPAEAVKTAPIKTVGEQAPAAPEATAVKVMPTIKVGETAPEQTVEKSEEALEAEEQLQFAEEVMKENAEALASFCEEHHVPFDAKRMKIQDASRLTKTERFYLQTLMGKHEAGLASKRHAEKLQEAYAFSENDPRRAALLQEAETLAKQAALKEKAAMVMQQNYLNLPEIAALVGGSGTGGSAGGADFEAQPSPFGPGEPRGPETPSTGGMGGLYDGGGAPGSGLTEVKAYKSQAEKVDKPKPSLIDRFVKGNVGKIKDWFGQFGPEEKGRE